MIFPFVRQLNSMDCGPACLKMIALYYGKSFKSEHLRNEMGYSKEGVSLLAISETAERIGLRSRALKIRYEQLRELPLPCILHWNQNHFVVLVKVRGSGTMKFTIADPGSGIITYKEKEFKSNWVSSISDNQALQGTTLLLEPTNSFFAHAGEKENRLSWRYIVKYLKNVKWDITQVYASLFFTTILQLAFPFVTQSIVDTGISTGNLQFVTIMLSAQLMLTFSQTVIEFVRSRILIRMSNSLNMTILSDFWIKMTRLPIAYFETHHTGDILQRIGDNRLIQGFITSTTFNTVFSLFNFLLYTFLLIVYSAQIFFVFAAFTILYLIWVNVFLKYRRRLNNEMFRVSAIENNATLELVQGMQEIRLSNAEKIKRWRWENIQLSLFNLNYQSLNYSQWQQAGAFIINQTKNILTTFLVAKLVINGKLTFGEMLSIQYIIAQVNSPIAAIVGLIQSAQDAKISMERLNDIHEIEDEEPHSKLYHERISERRTITISDLTFAYPGIGNEPVLDNINITMEEGKVTAVVGASGSGKTTLVKLLLGYYPLNIGSILVGGIDLTNIRPSFWRGQVGIVWQEGILFSDTIARNIAITDEVIDYDRLVDSCRKANILSFIESLPNGFHTKLGPDGLGISQGQKQRVLIARSIYKRPAFIFFDEATNSLDASNERIIVDNMKTFFEGKTVLVIAHRLSTIKNADKIIVLHKGKVIEEGKHQELCDKKGRYFELVKNQLEIGE